MLGDAVLPTPLSSYSRRSDQQWLAQRPNGSGKRRISIGDLEILLATLTQPQPTNPLLPTPTASDAKNCSHRTHTGGPSLPDQARLLPTPRASDTGTAGRKAGAGFRPPLSQQVLPLVDSAALLPTPRATDGTKGCPAQRGSKGDLMLPSAVMRLLIPTSVQTGGPEDTL
ncbi:hypothetical protein [Actinokineospora sp. NPDC004072]